MHRQQTPVQMLLSVAETQLFKQVISKHLESLASEDSWTNI